MKSVLPLMRPLRAAVRLDRVILDGPVPLRVIPLGLDFRNPALNLPNLLQPLKPVLCSLYAHAPLHPSINIFFMLIEPVEALYLAPSDCGVFAFTIRVSAGLGFKTGAF